MDPIKFTKEEFEKLVAGLVASGLDSKVKELGLDKVDRKFGQPFSLVGVKSQEELEAMSKKEKTARFIKALFYKDMGALAQMKAQSEGVGSEGGFAVPEEWVAEIARIAEDFGLVRKLARHVPMGSDTKNYPTLTTSVAVSFPGENTEGSDSDIVLANVQLLAKTAVGLTVLSNELLADANVSLVDYLSELYAEALAGSEDDQGLTGTGSPFTGILSASGTNVVTAPAGEDTFAEAANPDNLRDMISAVKSSVLPGSVFIMHRSVWGIVQKKKASDGHYFVSVAQPVLNPNSAPQQASLSAVGTIWGYPVYLSDHMPSVSAASTKFIIFGNMRNLWFGDRQTMTASISDSATIGGVNAFAANQSVLRVTERYALAVGLPAGFAVLETNAV